MPFIIFFPATGACRVFDSYNLAEATYPSQPIIQNEAGVLAAYHSHQRSLSKSDPHKEDSINDWHERLFEFIDSAGHLFITPDGSHSKAPNGTLHPRPKTLDDADQQTVIAAFWKLAIEMGNKVTKQPVASSEKKRGRPTGYTIDLVQANVVLAAIKVKETKVPAQVRQLIEVFTTQEHDYYDAKEMQRLCGSSHFYKTVKTGQDGWRIFRYYTPMLRELGVLK